MAFRDWWKCLMPLLLFVSSATLTSADQGEEVFAAKWRGEEVAEVTLPEMKAKEKPKPLGRADHSHREPGTPRAVRSRWSASTCSG